MGILYIPDESSIGLHPPDHHWIIDLGPEGGEEGGYVVVEGSPEAVAQVAESYTGRFLQ